MLHQGIHGISGPLAIIPGHVNDDVVRHQFLAHTFQLRDHTFRHRHRVRSGSFGDCNGNRRHLVVIRPRSGIGGPETNPMDALDLARPVTDAGDLFQINRPMAIHSHYQLTHILGIAEKRTGTNLCLEIAADQLTRWHIYVGGFQHAADIRQRHVEFTHLLQV